MSTNEEGGLTLMNLLKNLEGEKYLYEVMLELRKEKYQFWEAIRRHGDKIGEEYEESMRNHQHRIRLLKVVEKVIMRRREGYVREFINKEVIYVSNAAQLEAIIFLKREGWKGKALIHQEEFASKLSKNNIPFILQVP